MKRGQKEENRARSGYEMDLKNELGPAARTEGDALRRPGEVNLEFPVGEPDLEALRSVTREWLVPLLVEKFLRDQSTPVSDPKKPLPVHKLGGGGGAGTSQTSGADASGGHALP